MKYEKPDLEELELELEGSYLAPTSIGVEIGDDEGNDENWD